jgi:hypothetical protein
METINLSLLTTSFKLTDVQKTFKASGPVQLGDAEPRQVRKEAAVGIRTMCRSAWGPFLPS